MVAAELDAGLDFADGHTGEVKIGIVKPPAARQHAAMGAPLAQF